MLTRPETLKPRKTLGAMIATLAFGATLAATAAGGARLGAALGELIERPAAAASAQIAASDRADAIAAARAELGAKRDRAIAALRAYWIAGDFPVNVYKDVQVNIFRDGRGRLCAVANLIHASGRDDLVDAQVADDNFVRLRDVGSDGPIADWILDSGLTREELIGLQGAGYLPMPSQNLEAPRRDSMIAIDSVWPPAVDTQLEDVGGQLRVVSPHDREVRLAVERGELRTRLSAAEATLTANRERSLDLAARRLVDARASARTRATVHAFAPSVHSVAAPIRAVVAAPAH